MQRPEPRIRRPSDAYSDRNLRPDNILGRRKAGPATTAGAQSNQAESIYDSLEYHEGGSPEGNLIAKLKQLRKIVETKAFFNVARTQEIEAQVQFGESRREKTLWYGLRFSHKN